MRAFYLEWPIPQTQSAEFEKPGIVMTLSAQSVLSGLARSFSSPLSAYIRLLAVKSENAGRFYKEEALRGGWPVRQLDLQINSQFYERTVLSRVSGS